ncbi:hypothetical protein EV182_006090 [Spiromyces aspiralis]|uniref:Uncharacterized protein n=1 Tax=Spiromyces aspiralis TaxID=68401 RepID=A0ACC1HNY6_9FUNG|nr:hypothetical protein EV182_006090 [Spiromyces aspiralis]
MQRSATIKDELDGIDPKSLSPKERRQLRNKISARNFRVRRKEYIHSLEDQVRQYRDENTSLSSELRLVKAENTQLKDELRSLRRQLESLTLGCASSNSSVATATTGSKVATPVSATRPSPATGVVRASSSSSSTTATATAQSATNRPVSPIVRFRPNKDLPANGSTSKTNGAATSGSGQWPATKSAVITVQTMLMPDPVVQLSPAPVLSPTPSPRLDQLLGLKPVQLPTIDTLVLFYTIIADVFYSQRAYNPEVALSHEASPRTPLVAVFA